MRAQQLGSRPAIRAGFCAVAVTVAMTCTLTPVHAAPPVNPSNGQLSDAAKAKSDLAAKVGQLGAAVATAQSELNGLASTLALAKQKVDLVTSQLQDAQTKAAAAQAAVQAAQKNVDLARKNLTAFVQNSYIQPAVTSGVGNLLTAQDPNALLQRGDYVRYIADRHVDAVAALDKATVVKSNAVATAKTLVAQVQILSNEAAAAEAVATQAYQAQTTLTAQYEATLTSTQTQLASAKQQLATLNGQRAVYDAYVKKQAEIAAAKAEAERQARLRAEALQRQILLAQQAAARKLADQAAAQAAAQGNSSAGSAQSSADPTPLPPAGSGGSWTAAKGAAAAARAQSQLGIQYAWDGGNFYGPTYGVNSPGTDGWNDSTHFGFDCSGLTLYAWAPQGLYLTHYAATQYNQAGSYHPSSDQFMPGDLLFWSSNGTVSGIHHVALYIGGGNVVQAPDSNDIVKITPWDQVSPGYFGATRPLT